MMYCSKCGKELNESDVFCPSCGNKINNEITTNTATNKKNKGILFLLISIGIQIVAIIGSFAAGSFGNVMAILLVISVALVLASSIFCIIQAKKVENHKGRTLGIVFSILSGIVIVAIILGVAFGDNSKSKMDNQMLDVADKAVVLLQEKLKNPASLYLNSVSVAYSISDSSTTLGAENKKDTKSEFDGTYAVYIDYSAQNGLGGATRSYYRVVYLYVNGNFKLIDSCEVENIPEPNGATYEVNLKQLKSYSATLK